MNAKQRSSRGAAAMSDSSKKFLVTGATGKTGASVVRRLCERGEQVRALVHRQDERSAMLAAGGAEIIVGDMPDLAAVTAATRGIPAAYFTYPILPGLLEATTIRAHRGRDRRPARAAGLPAREGGA